MAALGARRGGGEGRCWARWTSSRRTRGAANEGRAAHGHRHENEEAEPKDGRGAAGGNREDLN